MNAEAPSLQLEAGQLAFEGDTLVVDGDTVDRRIRRKNMSPSTMNGLSNGGCEAMFAIDKLKGDDPNPMSPSRVGTLAHSVLEDLYSLDGDERTIETAQRIMLAKTADADLVGPDGAELTAGERKLLLSDLRGEVTTAFQGIFEIETPPDVRVFGTEKSLYGTSIRGVPMAGMIDRVDEFEDGKLKVNDYKTGKQKRASHRYGDPHGDQLRIYALGIEQLLDREVSDTSILYTKLAKVQKPAMSKARLEKTAKQFEKTWIQHNEAADSRRFATNPSPLCAWCPLAAICPSADTSKPAMVDLVDPDLVALYPDSGQPGHAESDPHTQVADDQPAPAIAAENTEPEEEEATMSIWAEDKSWIDKVNDRLNPNSYAAQGAVSVTLKAKECLEKAEWAANKRNVRALSSTFADIIGELMSVVGGHGAVDWGRGLNSRIRYIFFTLLDTSHPVPFASSQEDWSAWRETVIKVAAGLITTAEDVYDGTIKPGGWRVFVNDATPPEKAQPQAPEADEAEEDPAEGDGEEAEADEDPEAGESDENTSEADEAEDDDPETEDDTPVDDFDLFD